MRKEAENWWEQAKRDLRAASKNLDFREFHVAAFLWQQACEDSGKKIHDLIALARLADCPDDVIYKCKPIKQDILIFWKQFLPKCLQKLKLLKSWTCQRGF